MIKRMHTASLVRGLRWVFATRGKQKTESKLPLASMHALHDGAPLVAPMVVTVDDSRDSKETTHTIQTSCQVRLRAITPLFSYFANQGYSVSCQGCDKTRGIVPTIERRYFWI